MIRRLLSRMSLALLVAVLRRAQRGKRPGVALSCAALLLGVPLLLLSGMYALGFATGLRNAILDAITTFAGNSGKLRIYNSTQPATGGTATTLLAELTLNATFAGAASAGVLTLNAITSDASADNTGTATWFRIVKSDGTTHVMDGTVGTSGSDLNLNTTSIVSGGPVAVSSFTITAPNS